MKKIVWLSVCTATVVILLIAYFQKERVAGLQPALLLPKDTLVVIEQKRLQQKIDQFNSSRLGKAFRGINYTQIASDLGLQEEEIEIIKDIQNNSSEFMNSPIFTEIFGEDVTCAIINPHGVVVTDPEKTLKETLLFIAKPKHNAATLEKLATLFRNYAKQSVIQYGNHVIHRYEIEHNKSIAVARVEGLFLIALDQQIIRLSLDRYDEKSESLLDSKEYRDLKSSFDKTDLYVYFSIGMIKKQIEKIVQQVDTMDVDKVIEELATWDGWKAGAYGAWQNTEVIHEKSVILYDEESLHPYVKEMISIKPEKSDEIFLVSKDALAYYWTNTLNLQTLFAMYVEELGDENKEVENLNQILEHIAGINIEQVIAGIDRKIGFIIQEMNTEDFIPLPDFSIFLKLKDQKLIKGVLEKLLANWEIPYQSNNYRDVEFFFWGLVPQTGMQPVVSFYDGYLFVTSSVKMMKDIIDSAKDGNGLQTSDNFIKVEKGLLENNNSVAYIQVGAIVEIMKELVNWGGTMIAIQDRQAAHTSKILIDKLINPILDGLKMYSVIGARTYVAQGRIIYSAETFVQQN